MQPMEDLSCLHQFFHFENGHLQNALHNVPVPLLTAFYLAIYSFSWRFWDAICWPELLHSMNNLWFLNFDCWCFSPFLDSVVNVVMDFPPHDNLSHDFETSLRASYYLRSLATLRQIEWDPLFVYEIQGASQSPCTACPEQVSCLPNSFM